MKTVIIMSVITFVLIFGGIVYTTGMLEDVIKSSTMAIIQPDKPDLDRILTGLQTEQDQVEKEKAEVDRKLEELKIEQKFIAEEKIKLQGILAEIVVLNAEYIVSRDESSAKLAKLYESMKPAKAAPILASLDLEITYEIISNMKERQAAKIMSYLSPDLAAKISSKMSLKGEQG